jgi:iron-sulfur cluster assembly protein
MRIDICKSTSIALHMRLHTALDNARANTSLKIRFLIMCKFTLTSQAARQVRAAAHDSSCEGMFLRITARPGDAGAVNYGMGFDELRDDDIITESEGVSIIISPGHMPLLDGAVLDFASLNTGHARFVFVNPNDFGCAHHLGSCGHCDVTCRPNPASAKTELACG